MRKRTTGISIDEATLAELDAEAKSLRRSRSNLILSIIQDWLKQRKETVQKPAETLVGQPSIGYVPPKADEVRYDEGDDLF